MHGWRCRVETLIVDHRLVGSRASAAIIRSQWGTGLSSDVIAELVAEIGPLWHERHQAALKSLPRRRAVGAGAKYKLVFVDLLLATLVNLRHGAMHDVLACWFGVDPPLSLTVSYTPPGHSYTRTGPRSPWVQGNRGLFSANPRVERCASGLWLRGFG